MKVVPVIPERHHLENVALYLPEEQHLEIERYDGGDIFSTIEEAQEPGKELWALVHENGLTLGLTGCAPASGISDLYGCPWVLTTVHMFNHRIDFLRTARIMNEHYAHHYGRLVADVDATYIPGIKLMMFLGYNAEGVVQSPAGHPFINFQYRRA